MSRVFFLFIFLIVCANLTTAQGRDTLLKPGDTVSETKPGRHDSLGQPKSFSQGKGTVSQQEIDSSMGPALNLSLKDSAWGIIAARFPHSNFIISAFTQNKFFGFSSPPIVVITNKKEFRGKDLLFYAMVSLLLFFAVIRAGFSKYIGDLFRVAFRTTLKQRQISEQLVQTPVPSLLLNFFFLLSGGLYADFVLQHFHLTGDHNFWLVYFYCFSALAIIYILKFLGLKLSGWLFNISSVTDDYIFIVFMINKITGIYLLPFLILLAFSGNNVYEASFVISYIGVLMLFAYRFILAYALVQNQVRLNSFHFFLYLCAFEIIPLLLIYKALMLWF